MHCLYILISACSVSWRSTQLTIPQLSLNGVTLYVRTNSSCWQVSGFAASRRFTIVNSCITSSSWRRSSFPFSRNSYFCPSLPKMVILRGRCLLGSTERMRQNCLMRTISDFFSGEYVPGTAIMRFLMLRSFGLTESSSSSVTSLIERVICR